MPRKVPSTTIALLLTTFAAAQNPTTTEGSLFSPDERTQITALLHGGEDYELLFTASPTTKIPRSIANVSITRIGRILKPQKNKPPMSLITDGERFELQPQGWEHLT